MTELEQLIASHIQVQIAGESLTIAPLKVGQLPAFLRAITPLMDYLRAPVIDWLALLAQRGDDLLAALAIAVKKPEDWIHALNADEALMLAAKVMEVNADFFTRAVLPQLDGLMQHLPVAPTSTTGLTSSNG